MIAAIGSFLAKLGLTWLGNLILNWDSNRQATKANADQVAGANQQVIRDTADTAETQGRIAQAEAQTDKTATGIADAARKGDF